MNMNIAVIDLVLLTVAVEVGRGVQVRGALLYQCGNKTQKSNGYVLNLTF